MAHGRSPKHVRRKRARPQHAEEAKPALGAAAPSGPARLQKILAGAGFASRRGAEEFLRQGRVTVNGVTAKLGDSADPACDRVALDGERIRLERPRYWMLHKPRGVLTTLRDPEGRETVLGLLPEEAGRLFPVGRLDLATSGLLLLTNDGEMGQRLLHPSLGNEREYRVTIKGEMKDKTVRRLERGVHLEDGVTAPAEVKALHYDRDSRTSTLVLILREGRNRQIRRSLLALGHPVKGLVRTRFGPLRLGSLSRGRARPLRDDEIRALRAHSAGLVKKRAPARQRPARSRRPSAPR